MDPKMRSTLRDLPDVRAAHIRVTPRRNFSNSVCEQNQKKMFLVIILSFLFFVCKLLLSFFPSVSNFLQPRVRRSYGTHMCEDETPFHLTHSSYIPLIETETEKNREKLFFQINIQIAPIVRSPVDFIGASSECTYSMEKRLRK